jgi:hypothetical protein
MAELSGLIKHRIMDLVEAALVDGVASVVVATLKLDHLTVSMGPGTTWAVLPPMSMASRSMVVTVGISQDTAVLLKVHIHSEATLPHSTGEISDDQANVNIN